MQIKHEQGRTARHSVSRVLPFAMPVLRSVLFLLGGLSLPLLTGQPISETSRWWSVLCTGLNLVTITILLAVCRFEQITFTSLIKGQSGKPPYSVLLIVFLMMVTGIGFMIAVSLVIYGQMPVLLIQPIPVWVAAVNTLLLPLTIVLAELPLYYGYALPRIEAMTGHSGLASAYVIFFYALQHSFMPVLPDVTYMLFRFLSFIPLMLLIVFLYRKNRNLIPMMAGHGVMDVATGLQILIISWSPGLLAVMTGA